MIHLLVVLFIGLIVGLLARALMPGPDPMGLIVTSLLGIAGAFVATYLGHVLGIYRYGHPAGFIASVLGAMLVLALYHLLSRQRRRWV